MRDQEPNLRLKNAPLSLEQIDLLIQATELINELIRDEDANRTDYIIQERDRVIAMIYLEVDLSSGQAL